MTSKYVARKLKAVKPPSESEEDSLDEMKNIDIDPEDLDFGGMLDKTGASVMKKKKRGELADNDDLSREHYGTLPSSDLKKRKRSAPLPIDDEDFMSGRYSGVKTSRRDLGYQESEDESGDDLNDGLDDLLRSDFTEDEDEDEQEGEYSNISENEEDNSMEADGKMLEQLNALGQEEEEHLEMIAQRSTSNVEKGKQVKSQLYKWQNAVDLRVRLQSILTMSNRLPSPAIMNIFEEVSSMEAIENGINNICDQLVNTLESFIDHSTELTSVESRLKRLDSRLSRGWKSSLDSWHQKANVELEGTSGKKATLKVINQSLWSQVEMALREKDRLIAKALQPKSSSQTPLIPSHSSDCLYDDQDFFTTLARTWVDMGVDNDSLTTAGLVIRNVKDSKDRESKKVSKDRKMKFDVQDKIVNYMVPQRDPLAWNDEKIDAFYSSIFPSINVH